MRRLMLVLAFVCASSAAFAQAPSEADASGIRKVIEGQLAAFARDDGAGAFTFASPGIQAMFGTPDTFMAMVRGGFPSVYRPREVEFRDLASEGGRLVQRVFLIGPDGKPVIARYTMERQADGSWRIAGCVLEDAPDIVT